MSNRGSTELRKRVNTRRRLRAAAGHVFRDSGIAGTSIDRLCEAAGFSRGAFYSNYTTKHDLALELLSHGQDEEIALWRKALHLSEDLDEIFGVLEERFNLLVRSSEWGRLNFELQMEAQRNELFAQRFEAYLEKLYGQVCELVERLCRMAGVAVSHDVYDLAMGVRCMTMGLMLHIGRDTRMPAFESPGRIMLLYFRGIIETAR